MVVVSGSFRTGDALVIDDKHHLAEYCLIIIQKFAKMTGGHRVHFKSQRFNKSPGLTAPTRSGAAESA
jgi:hypothetical protein